VGSSAGIRLAGCEPLRNRPAGDRSGLLGIEARPACRLDLHGAQDRPSSGDQLGRDRRSVRLDQSVGIEAFVLVSGTRTHRSLSSEVSFRSFDAVRMLDQSRWHRHCPDVRARRGTVVGSGWSAGAFGWSLRPMLGEGVPLSGPIRGQTRPPRPVPCARAISGASQAPSGRCRRIRRERRAEARREAMRGSVE
jgi:hypothetical protein